MIEFDQRLPCLRGFELNVEIAGGSQRQRMLTGIEGGRRDVFVAAIGRARAEHDRPTLNDDAKGMFLAGVASGDCHQPLGERQRAGRIGGKGERTATDGRRGTRHGPAGGKHEIAVAHHRRNRSPIDQRVVHPDTHFQAGEFDQGHIGGGEYKRDDAGLLVAADRSDIAQSRAQHHRAEHRRQKVLLSFRGKSQALDVNTRQRVPGHLPPVEGEQSSVLLGHDG